MSTGTCEGRSVPMLPSAPGWSGTWVRRSSYGSPSPQAFAAGGSVAIRWLVTDDGPQTSRAAATTGAIT